MNILLHKYGKRKRKHIRRKSGTRGERKKEMEKERDGERKRWRKK
jgi:hypothetical protein